MRPPAHESGRSACCAQTLCLGQNLTPMLSSLSITLPDWIAETVDWNRRYQSREDRMRLAIALSRENVVRQSGGPFGAAVFESESGALVSVGVNSVVRLRNSALHAEVTAIMFAQQRVQSYTLHAEGLPEHEVVSSCEPCAMCLGAVLWSGARRLICGADRRDAERIHFDEGPVFRESYGYLENRGLEVVRAVLGEEAGAVLALYERQGGKIYNG
jgi:tRNA(Arg) A34 adenosine deaminase TadA